MVEPLEWTVGELAERRTEGGVGTELCAVELCDGKSVILVSNGREGVDVEGRKLLN